MKNDITNILEPQKPVIYSRYMKSGLSAYTLEKSQVLELHKIVRYITVKCNPFECIRSAVMIGERKKSLP